MPTFNFQTQFAEAVELGIKRQTVRAPRKDGRMAAKTGDRVTLYTGMRTKQCRLLNEGVITSVQSVRIEGTCMYLDGNELPKILYDRNQLEPTDNEFAQADGFEGFMEMTRWFRKTYGLPFEGYVFGWEPIG